TRSVAHGAKFKYEVENYPFKDELETMYGVELHDLHNWLGSFEKFERKNDQQTIVHRVFYSNYKERIEPIYKKFMRNVLSKIIDFPFAYQKIPTFRIGLPGNRFVGEYHSDSKYNHPDFELNFNLGLSNYLEPCCLMSEKNPNSNEFFPLECPYGEIFSFNHIDCLHGSDINTTNKTMVSMDFRLAMLPFYEKLENKSVNMASSFTIGDYFSSEIINS
ncbi:hypothetical protein OAX96_03970, partial [Prochlorococcus sp. AH-736-K15]|nr:hypothetical protein [Prochlorococcus sp. AH-736-K15]